MKEYRTWIYKQICYNGYKFTNVKAWPDTVNDQCCHNGETYTCTGNPILLTAASGGTIAAEAVGYIP